MSYRIDYVSFDEIHVPCCIHDNGNSNVYTVLIGKNGSGKSRALSTITNVLCSVYVGNKLLKRDIGTVSQYNQEDSYSSISVCVNGHSYDVEVRGRSIFVDNGIDAKSICPVKIIAASTSPFDKFPEENLYFSGKGLGGDFYNYYGLDDKSKTKALLALIQRVFFSFSDGTLSNNKYTIKKLLGFLGLSDEFEIHFRLKHGINKFMSNLSSMSVRDFMNYVSSAAQRDLSYLHGKYEFDYLKLKKAFEVLNKYCAERDLSRIISFEIFFNELKVTSKLKGFLFDIKILAEIGILNIHDVVVKRKSSREQDGWQWWDEPFKSFSISDASSGQQCILLNILGIAASIENNTLVLIDEPEISLHPEWQETYIELLMDSFTHVTGCHFIIATHSPQIVSKLSSENCFISLIGKGKIISSSDFVNKSADFQLATIFDAPGIDNEYLKRISVNILSAFSNGSFKYKEYEGMLNILMKNKDKVDEGDSVKKLIDLAIEISERYLNNEVN